MGKHDYTGCPHCGAHCTGFDGDEPIMWDCGTMKCGDGEGPLQSLTCRVRFLEGRVKYIKSSHDAKFRTLEQKLAGRGEDG